MRVCLNSKRVSEAKMYVVPAGVAAVLQWFVVAGFIEMRGGGGRWTVSVGEGDRRGEGEGG